MSSLSPLNLLFYGIESFSYRSNKAFKNDAVPVIAAQSVVVDLSHQVAEDDESLHRLLVEISIVNKGKAKPPYLIKMSMTGVFEVDLDFTGSIDMLVNINGGSILYGAAREYTFLATAHGEFGSCMLPTMSFRPPPPPTKKE